ncbi:MAG: DUF4328 domain-containing protein [Acidobacteriota bacterium]
MNYNHHYRSAKTLSWLVIAALAVVGICEMIAGLIGIAQITDPGRKLGSGAGELASNSIWLVLQGVLALLQFPVYILSIVLFLVWLFRIYKNLPSLRSASTEFTPGWAVGWWFIPFANLVKPFQVVRSAWSESDPNFDPQTGFLTSVQAGAPAFMSLWWAFWILSNIAANITSKVYDPDKGGGVQFSGYFFILTGILSVAAAAFAIKVVMDITERQDQRFKNIGLVTLSEPPPPPIFVGQNPWENSQ